jgi:hypothetical protein
MFKILPKVKDKIECRKAKLIYTENENYNTIGDALFTNSTHLTDQFEAIFGFNTDQVEPSSEFVIKCPLKVLGSSTFLVGYQFTQWIIQFQA